MLILFALIVLVVGAIIATSKSAEAPEPVEENQAQSPLKTEETMVRQTQVTVNGETYKAAWFTVDDPSRITLSGNFEKNVSSNTFLTENSCKALVNGGFYTVDGKPTGQFVEGKKEVRKFSENDLLNSVVGVNADGNFFVQKTRAVSPIYAVQTGPLLVEKERAQTLSLVNDKYARRLVAAKAGSNAYFVAFYKEGSVYQGPLLVDLPKLVVQFSESEGLSITEAVNLDGGSASVLISGDFHLTELMPVGSFFCIK